MKLSQGDIIERRERDGRTALWVSEHFLLREFSDSDETYFRRKARYRYSKTVRKRYRDQNIQPDTGATWRWAKFSRGYYYDYDRLPDERRAMLPAKSDLVKQHKKSQAERSQGEIEKLVKEALESGYKSLMHCYSNLSDRHNVSLARAAAVIIASSAYLNDKEEGIGRSAFFKDLARAVRKQGVQYLPGNWRRLKEKVAGVLDGSPVEEVITLPRRGNKNAQKFSGDKEVLSWLIQMRVAPQNYTNAYIIRVLERTCRLADKATPSRSWFAAKLAEPKTKWLTAPGRFGDSRHAAFFHGYVPVQNAIYAGDCWQIDGTRVNFIPYWDENGERKSLYIVAVIDVHSGDVLGWHFDTKEDRYVWAEAIKMACNMHGYLPWEMVIDRFPGHNTEEWQTIQRRMEREGVKVTITSKKTGKAKAERFFSTLQTVFMQESDYYYGEGVQSRNKHAHRSAEYLKQMEKQARQEGWTKEDAWKEAARILEMYRNTKYSEYSRRYHDIDASPREIHSDSDKPHAVSVEPWTYAELFGFEKTVSIRGGVIKTEINKAVYTYIVDDYDIVSQHPRVTLCYDMEDLSKVYLFEASEDTNRKYLGEVKEERAAQIYGPDADPRQLGRLEKRLKAIEERRKEEVASITDAGDETPLLMGAFTDKGEAASAESRHYESLMNARSRSNNTLKLNETEPEKEEDLDDDVYLGIRNQY